MLLKLSTAFTRMFFLGATSLTPNVTISKAGAGFVAPTNPIIEIANGWYALLLDVADTNVLGQLAYHLDAGTPADFEDQVFAQVLGDDLFADVREWNGSAAPTLSGGRFPAQVELMIANVLTAAALNVDAIDKLWNTRPLAQGYAADGTLATPNELLYMIWSALSEFSIAGGTLTCKQLDGSTNSMTFTLSPAGNPTSRARSS